MPGEKSVWAYILGRVVMAFFSVIGLVLITFVISHIIPGDPIRALVGPEVSADVVAHLRHVYGLDRPLYEQLVSYVVGFFTGNLGISVRSGGPVLSDIATYLPNTIQLGALAIAIAFVVGISAGSISAIRKNTVTDHFVRGFSLLGLSMPTFWSGVVLVLVFALRIRLFPVFGLLRIGAMAPPSVTRFILVDSLLAGSYGTFWDVLSHMVLPAIALAFWASAWIGRLTRVSVLEAMSQDHVTAARAKGLRESLVFSRHILRNALITPVTVTAMLFGWIVEASIATDLVFSYPGLGTYLYNSIYYGDYNAVAGSVLIIGVIFVIASLLADLLYSVIDPRVRYA